MSRIKVLIVDDSAVVRMALAERLERDAGIELLGSTADPVFAMAKMKQAWPDVMVLDVEMPCMDGMTFLKQLMAERPTAVVTCSTLTEKGAEVTLQALAAGAASVVTKSKLGLRDYLRNGTDDLVQANKAAQANLRQLEAGPGQPLGSGRPNDGLGMTGKVVAIVAHGLKGMRDAGARTLAQDEARCVVFGMPKEAIRLAAAERVVSLDEIPGEILGLSGIRQREDRA
ncbi:hypothetical protein C7H85_10910 [Zobellella endophytica]|uniref:protein-glutamate methylesterase n=1 Tax=Zobellella endophytica TaxID=2116700 RepID=A0A2P7R4P1_9GAMM|nr:response regulator [Zobellella endophytica]PSJ45170.1 hypothetical protein C7H85_10910 [Zobellella endophytica]